MGILDGFLESYQNMYGKGQQQRVTKGVPQMQERANMLSEGLFGTTAPQQTSGFGQLTPDNFAIPLMGQYAGQPMVMTEQYQMPWEQYQGAMDYHQLGMNPYTYGMDMFQGLGAPMLSMDQLQQAGYFL